jgi:hypothetical protein
MVLALLVCWCYRLSARYDDQAFITLGLIAVAAIADVVVVDVVDDVVVVVVVVVVLGRLTARYGRLKHLSNYLFVVCLYLYSNGVWRILLFWCCLIYSVNCMTIKRLLFGLIACVAVVSVGVVSVAVFG